MEILKKSWNWIVVSSADPQKVSLTIKGFLPLLVLFGVSPHLQGVLGSDADTTVQLIVKIGEAGTAIAGVYGLVRKIYNSFSN